MSFMQAQITDKQEWIAVDGNNGTDYIPADLVNVPRLRELLADESADDLPADAVAMIRDYTENSRVTSIEIVTGYGVRSSAPGYLDATPWEVYGNKREAMQAYRQHERDCD